MTIVALALTILLPGVAAIQGFDDLENEVIQYRKRQPTDAVTRVQAKLDSGALKFTYDPQHGYLKSVLYSLGIPSSSQTLVFSKTSFQRDLISPNHPRALYFNDQSYVGWVQGGRVVEVATVDPQLGTVFYVLDQSPNGKPRFLRKTDECLQ
jgi:hypothetical protein